MSRLTYQARKHLPTSDFAEPGKRAYPIPDQNHARAALQRVSEFGDAAEKHAVRHAVAVKYPNIKISKGK